MLCREIVIFVNLLEHFFLVGPAHQEGFFWSYILQVERHVAPQRDQPGIGICSEEPGFCAELVQVVL